jgi:hypothetical protein
MKKYNSRKVRTHHRRLAKKKKMIRRNRRG